MSDEIKFRKTDNNQTIAIKEGEVVGGAGTSIGPDNLPSFSSFVESNPKLKDQSYTKNVTQYLTNYFKGKEIAQPAGLPVANKVLFTRAGIKKTASGMNKNKEKVLPYIFDVYRTGNYLGSTLDEKSHPGVKKFHYTQKTINVGKEKLKVTLCSREMDSKEFQHYLIDKADKANDSKKAFDLHSRLQRPRWSKAHRNPPAPGSALNESQNPVAGSGKLRFVDILAQDSAKAKAIFELVDFEVEEVSNVADNRGIAWDKASVREIDNNGFLHVAISPLTREQVAPYLGSEIPGWQSLGLEPDRTYFAYRPAEELSKEETVKSVNGIPIQFRHHPDYAENPAKETRVGSTGSNAEWRAPFLMNSLHVFDKEAQEAIKSGALRELSLAYSYTPDFSSGVAPSGEKYDFVMRNILANHVALVEEGRAGPEVLVLDHSFKGKTMDENVKKAQDGDPAVEATEVALAQAIIDLHQKKANGETVDVTVDEDKNAAIERIISKAIEGGLPADKAEELRNALSDLAYTKPTGDEEPKSCDEGLQKTDAKDEGESTEEPKPTTQDDGEELSSAEFEEKMKDPAFREAFEMGVKYGEKREKADPKRIDRDHESEGEKRALGEDSVKKIRDAFSQELQAIEAVKPVLGAVRFGAYDSAGSVYVAALNKLGIKGVDKSEARSAFLAYMAGRNSRAGQSKGMAQDSVPSIPNFLTKALSNVKDY